LSGYIVRESSSMHSSWRAERSLQEYLAGHGIVAASEIDTRRLTRHLRTRGAMKGALSSVVTNRDDLVDIARGSPGLVGRDLAAEVSTPEPYTWDEQTLAERTSSGFTAGREVSPTTAALLADWTGPRYRVAAFDFGIKRNILDLLVSSGFDVTVVPAQTSAEEIVGYDGVFLSNGPGDPEPVTYAIETLRALIGRVPIFGICLGHQLLGLALNARTYKLPFGHRGGNHPVARVGHSRVEITCQNHGFAVDAASLTETQADLTHTNLNDGTVEGIAVPGVAYSVQYHPEAGPGPHDSRYLFTDFRTLIDQFEARELDLARRSEAVVKGGK
ncbi:MAG TPA: glutamine-hydrolyzing carbamoyl-phosphate synthase small subunit, partial [Actinomycetota bacterium]|nr:glutamine-hydrolyzing carbamoyl-phosphate synthase small subunit [Actinomycetota bacterium]